ncbi:MAG: gamma-glutamyl-gamma-aminobutyrate hydrolase family protein [Planctomycetota bacterium]
MTTRAPIIGISTDIAEAKYGERWFSYRTYAHAITKAGGLPVAMSPDANLASDYAERLDGFVLTGGDDPVMEPFGVATDARVTPVHTDRQAFESSLIEALLVADKPMLGVCLGMQMMALHAQGKLDQYMPDSTDGVATHWDVDHDVAMTHVAGGMRTGVVHSRHKQAITDAGTLAVVGRSPDGVIEAIADTSRRFWVGVQWHPERTAFAPLGSGLFDGLIAAARS